MIRGNYSLAKEVRKNELRQKQKTQQRQKYQYRLEKLTSVDPIKLYLNIERISSQQDLDHHQQKRLKTLKEDWDFILKNKLHQDKVSKFLDEQKKKKLAEEKRQAKLLGKESIYFNAELNPLGKVPDVSRTSLEGEKLSNLTKVQSHHQSYAPDPLIKQWNIPLPDGPPPRFYKSVQNISVKKVEQPVLESPGPLEDNAPNLKHSLLDSDSDSDSHIDYHSKRTKT